MKKVAITRTPAVTKEGFQLHGNFHFSIMPMPDQEEFTIETYRMMGYEIAEVDDEQFKRLHKGFGDMIRYQLEVNMIYNKIGK